MTCHVHGNEKRQSNACKNLLQEEWAEEKPCRFPLDSHKRYSNYKVKTLELELKQTF